MMRRLPPFAVNTKKRLVKSSKLYIRDSGLLTCLLDLDSFDKLYGHPAYGACWEGFAVENVLATLQPRGMYGFYGPAPVRRSILSSSGRGNGSASSSRHLQAHGSRTATRLPPHCWTWTNCLSWFRRETPTPSRPTGSG